ncbi:MAG: hypothetical protein P1U42_02100 [Phycisphaerales bacterium]|nr:hypothetical protein [Phycisphaerales bacterium]
MNSSIPFVNLIPEKRVIHRYKKMWIKRWVIGSVLTGVFVGLPGLYIGGSAVFTDSGITDQIDDAKVQYANHQQKIPLLNNQLSLLLAEKEVHDLIKNRVEWRKVFAVLVDASQEDVRFQRVSAIGGGVEGIDPIEINLEGFVESQTDARTFVVRLEEAHVFDSVSLVETMRETFGEIELVKFRVLITITGTLQTEAGEANDL